MRKILLPIGLLLSSLCFANNYSVAPLLPEKQVVVRSEVSGIVNSYQYKNGDTVKKGNTLLALSTRDYTLNVSLAKFEQDVSKSELETQKKQLKRYQSLYKTKGISASDLDNQLRLTNISQAQYNVSSVKHDIAKETFKKSQPGAPFDGVIVERAVELGQFISIGDPLYTLADTHRLKIRLHLLESDFRQLKKGDRLKVEIPSTGKSLVGVVTVVSPSIQLDAPGFVVEVSLDNRDGGLSAGMESRVYLQAEVAG